MKKLLYALLGLILAFVAFYFWGSSSNWDAKKYNQLKQFSNNALASTDTLSVMTYNIGWMSGMTNNLPVDRKESLYADNLHAAIRFLKKTHPNIIGFQEIDIQAKRSYFYNQPDSLGYNLGYLNGALAVNWDKKYVPFPYWPFQYHFGKLISGQYIMSDLKILKNDFVVLPQPINAPFYYNAFYLDRLIQKSILKTKKGKLMVMNVHLEAFDQETRALHADLVIKEYRKYADTMPVLLIGDFNSRAIGPNGPLDESVRKLYAVPGINMAISDSAFLSNPQKNFTFSSGEPVEKIDYIFYNKKYIKKLGAHVVQEIGEVSDHFPVCMRFVIR
jgi:endonuclease/exonuclease/phosphatase family metal-dependent hydrolase